MDDTFAGELSAWLSSAKYWFKYASKKILENNKIDDELIGEALQLFLEDNDLVEKTFVREEMDFSAQNDGSDVIGANCMLTGIKNVQNVNALAANQIIKVSPNLTLVFGNNGAGKSGYVRLLNNAFSSRGDKEILQDVFSDSAPLGEARAVFSFLGEGGVTRDLLFPEERESGEFKLFTVFDNESVKVHLEGDNKLNFTPEGFLFFDFILKLYEELKSRVLTKCSERRIENKFVNYFENDNVIGQYVRELSSKSKIEVLDQLALFDEKNGNDLSTFIVQKDSLKSQNIAQRIVENQRGYDALNQYLKAYNDITSLLSDEKINEYKILIDRFHYFDKISKEEGVESLSIHGIPGLASPEWKGFILAAKSYLDAIKTDNNVTTYPSSESKCLFCLQPLPKSQQELIDAYWRLLSSEAEAQRKLIVSTIKESLAKLRQMQVPAFDENTMAFVSIRDINPELAEKWKGLCTDLFNRRTKVIDCLSVCKYDQDFVPVRNQTKELEGVLKLIEGSIEKLKSKDPADEITKLEGEINFLKDKNLLNKMKEEIKEFILDLKWAEKAERACGEFRTNAITTKQGELFSKYVSDKYLNTFKKESEYLDAPIVVDIVQRNVKAATLRKLQVRGKLANKILSEGEQRAVSIADFLTEAQINPNTRGVIFDDPVCSLDHIRKDKIAKRLVRFSEKLQVVIFTHDISFFQMLHNHAKNSGVNVSILSIRNSGQPGLIVSDTPWITLPISKRIGILKNRLIELKKIEKEGDQDKFLIYIKSFYGMMRECWERSVEERLFKSVIERFSPAIQTQKLRHVMITPELLEDIEKGMTECSNWVHDSAANLNPPIPDTIKAETDLEFLVSFADRCKAP